MVKESPSSALTKETLRLLVAQGKTPSTKERRVALCKADPTNEIRKRDEQRQACARKAAAHCHLNCRKVHHECLTG